MSRTTSGPARMFPCTDTSVASVSPAQALAYWTSLKGNDPTMVQVHGILPTWTNNPYMSLVSAAGGRDYDITTLTAWGDTMAEIGRTPLRCKRRTIHCGVNARASTSAMMRPQ